MNEMVAQCFLFFFAGFETSSTTMTFVLFELSQHQEIQEKLREELIRVLKKYDNRMCYDLLIELEYMGQVIEGILFHLFYWLTEIPFLTTSLVSGDQNI